MSTRMHKIDGRVDALFRALADPSRRRILGLLAERELPLKGIEAEFSISRPAVLKHLRVLKSAHLVETRRSGRETIHRLNRSPLRTVTEWVAHFDVMWDKHLVALKQQVEADRADH